MTGTEDTRWPSIAASTYQTSSKRNDATNFIPHVVPAVVSILKNLFYRQNQLFVRKKIIIVFFLLSVNIGYIKRLSFKFV